MLDVSEKCFSLRSASDDARAPRGYGYTARDTGLALTYRRPALGPLNIFRVRGQPCTHFCKKMYEVIN